MRIETYRLTGIKWITDVDCRRQRVRLPQNLTVSIPINKNDDSEGVADKLTDYISDEYGFLHQGFEFVPFLQPQAKEQCILENPKDLRWYNSTDSAGGYDKNIPKSVFNPASKPSNNG